MGCCCCYCFLCVILFFCRLLNLCSNIIFVYCEKPYILIYIHIRVADSICFNLKHYVFKILKDERIGLKIVTNILIDMLGGFFIAIIEFSIIHKTTRLNSSFPKKNKPKENSFRIIQQNVCLCMLDYGCCYVVSIIVMEICT